MAIQQFTAGQTLTAAAMNTLQASDFNYTRKIVTAATYTAVLEDRGQLLEFQNAGGTTVTIPPNSSVAFSLGDVLEIISSSSATVQIVGDTGVTIEATGGITSLTSAWQKAQLVKRETDNWVLTGITSVAILDSTITNADVANNAAIALSKIASGAAAQVVIANSSGVPTYTTISGDVTIDSTGNAQIAADKIVNADINTSAAIDKTKISGTAVTLADTGTITSTMIAEGAIVNADINASAAIAYSKLDIANSVSTTDLASGAPRAGFRSAQNPQTNTTYTLALSDLGALVELNNASPITLTVPLDSSVAFVDGDRIDIVQTGAGQVTVVGAGGITLNAYDNQFKLNGQFAVATLIKRAANTWLLVGNITS